MSAVVLTPGERVDRYGDRVEDWESPTETEIQCIAWPVDTRDVPQVGRDQIHRMITIATPPDVVIPMNARVQLGGYTYVVDGIPWSWSHPMTLWRPGNSVNLVLKEG